MQSVKSKSAIRRDSILHAVTIKLHEDMTVTFDLHLKASFSSKFSEDSEVTFTKFPAVSSSFTITSGIA